MITSNAIDYTQKRNDVGGNKKSFQHTSAIVLGNQNQHAAMQTMNQHYFNQK